MNDYLKEMIQQRILADLRARLDAKAAAIREAQRNCESRGRSAFWNAESLRYENARAAEEKRLAAKREYNRQYPDRRTRWRQTRNLLDSLDSDAREQAERFEEL